MIAIAHDFEVAIECKDCERIFILSVEEQQFFVKKELSTPQRCPDCRYKRKHCPSLFEIYDAVNRIMKEHPKGYQAVI
jgi:hypothetical protein